MGKISTSSPPVLRWVVFGLVLAAVVEWAMQSVFVRARAMRPADTPNSEFLTLRPGSQAKAVTRLTSVIGEKLAGILLERQSDTIYRLPRGASSADVTAYLQRDTAVVMEAPQQIQPGATVQVADTLDNQHCLHASRVVIVTGYVRVTEAG